MPLPTARVTYHSRVRTPSCGRTFPPSVPWCRPRPSRPAAPRPACTSSPRHHALACLHNQQTRAHFRYLAPSGGLARVANGRGGRASANTGGLYFCSGGVRSRQTSVARGPGRWPGREEGREA
jgi:hypothetical protein